MMAADCLARMRRRCWKTAAAFWAGHSAAESRPDGTVELHTDTETEQEQRRYHLRAMLVREMRTMPERGDPEDKL